MHERQEHELSSFITLTYAPHKLPLDGSLDPEHPKAFFKKLRKLHEGKIKYFLCGEYGDELQRPHYHAILFGIDWADKKKAGKGSKGDQLYTSEFLDKTWGHGHCWAGQVTHASAAYVARYVLKKVTGKAADEHYQGKTPEFIRMSKGIGLNHYLKYKDSLYARDFVTYQGKQAPVPAYYDRQLEKENPERLEALKRKRQARAALDQEHNTSERLRVREEVKIRSINHFAIRKI